MEEFTLGFDIDRVVGGFSEVTGSSNRVLLYGELLGVEETGVCNGVSSDIVLMRTERDRNKALYVWVALPSAMGIRERIGDGMYVYVEGFMETVYTFNDLAVSHTFVVPELFCEVDGLFELPTTDEFYLNYTMNNRVEIEGVVNKEPWREYIPPARNYVTRFSIEYEVRGRKRSIYCTMWDTVNEVGLIERGDRVSIVGSFSLLKKDRGLEYGDGVVTAVRKNKLDSYVIVVQRLERLGNSIVEGSASRDLST